MKKRKLNIWKLSAGVAALAVLVLIGRNAFRPETPSPSIAALEPGNNQSAKVSPTPSPSAAQPAETPSAATNKLFLTPDLLWQRPIAEETFARFHDWADQYRAATPGEKPALEAKGVELAQARRKELAVMIQTDPERALELTVPLGVRRELPAAVESLLEERVSGRGNLAVFAALPEPGMEAQVRPNFRTVELGTREFDAYVYGWRLGEPTRTRIPLQGIAVDNLMAVSANSLRILEPEEAAAVSAQAKEAVCSVSGQAVNVINEEVAADVGGEVTFFCRRAHADQTNDKLTAAQSGGGGVSANGETVEPSAWTEGLKKVLIIRVDFPDLTGVPLSDATATNLINNLHNFYNEMSYGRAGFYLNGNGSDFTPTFRMTNSAAWYGTNDYYNPLRSEARAAATAAGYVLSNYDRDVICMGSVPGFGWAGLAYVGAAGAWLRNSFGTGVAGHELGHNWGLNHANYWDTSGASVIGPGTSVEYGDSFDTMGSTSSLNNHFNARFKNYLNWLTTNEVVTATSNGVYRIYAHDNPNSFGIRGLRVVKNSTTNYWVEFRQKFTSNKWLMSGGGLRWAQNGNQKSQLLDTTPGSTDGKTDSALVIGRTFSDSLSGIHITPIGKGGTSPESLDVVVNVGTFPGNLPPTLDFSASATNATTGVTISFTAVASDPNGDDLSYYWDFGDGNFGTNSPMVGKSWSAAGEYLVRCVASDMKGGVTFQSLIVTIGSPTTYRISGSVLGTNGPVQGVRVYVSTTRMSYTDNDGTYDIVGLPAGSYTVNASLENYTFTVAGFTNPVSVGPSRTGIDFAANYTTLTAPAITSQPLSQTVNPGAAVTFTVSATGSAPMSYQWRFNGANISGATGSSYTKSNVQLTNAGNYSVLVSNVAGTATSANAVLSVNSPPTITAQPQGLTVIGGANATFSVTAGGSSPLNYQWRFNGTNLAGATVSSYTRLNAQPVHVGNYTVVVTNSLGSVTSAPASLTVKFALYASATSGGTVAKSPDQASYAPNSVVTLTAASAGSFPFDGWTGDASGTNNPLALTMTTNLTILANFISPVADLIVDNPQAAFTGNWTTDTSAGDKYGPDYRTAGSSSQSASATATFRPTVPTSGRYDVYAWWPAISKGALATPFLVSSSDGDMTVNLNQSSGSGGWVLVATGKMFTVGTNGYVRVANNVGQGGKNVAADAMKWVYSANQSIAAPTILTQPTNQTAIAGADVAFQIAADGTPPLNFQWRFNDINLAGANNATLSLTNIGAASAGDYTAIVSNGGGAVTSAVATLTVLLPPVINAQPQDQTVVAGGTATLGVNVSGTTPLSCQWRFNGANLSGETNGSLAVADAQPTDAGNYSVVITNVAGSTTSVVATLTVLVPPQILSPPQPQRAREGQSATFNVAADGTAPLTYQWRFNAAPIIGETNAAILLPTVNSDDAGDYDVTVRNLAGVATSASAALVISVPPVFASIEVSPDGQPRLTLTGTAGDRYAIDVSTNLLNWTEVTTLMNLTGTVQFTNTPSANDVRQFYRGRLLE